MLNKGRSSKNDSRKRTSRNILIGTLTAAFIAITPYLFYSYEYFPKGPIWDTWLFTYESKYQESVSIAMWIYMGKLIPLTLLILWFFTCKHWWYHIILIPIAMYAFQLFSVFIEDTAYFDEVEIYWLLPIMMVIIPFVYFIRIRLYDRHVHGIDLEAMEAELEALRSQQTYKAKVVEEVDEDPVNLDELTLSDRINYLLSTRKLESYFRQLQRYIQNHLHLKL